MELKETVFEVPVTAVSENEDVNKVQQEFPHKPIYDIFKRIFDIVFSIFCLIILAVPLVIVAIIILIDSPGASPIYIQERVGKNGKHFKLFKFRSMVPGAEKMLDSLLDKNEVEGPAFKIKDDPRLTRFGSFIRKTSIDELPQLLNVIKGEMSVVGPRPPLPREVEMYSEEQKKRLAVIPGITCFWQVQPKRNSISFDEWLNLDLKYIRERCFVIDFIIIFKTIGAVCGMEGE